MAVAVAKRRRVGSGLGYERTREALVGYGFVALAMAFFLAVFIFPIGDALYQKKNIAVTTGDPQAFVGWDNYRRSTTTMSYGHAVRKRSSHGNRSPLKIAFGSCARRRRQPGDPVKKFFRAAFTSRRFAGRRRCGRSDVYSRF